MLVDLHNHTPLCNHAEGSVEEYVQKAIQKGRKYFGFSDHAPMDFDPKYRMSFEDMKTYENEVLHVKHKYADKINILLGYEVDFLPEHMDARVLNAKVDYLIGSVHFINKWGFDNPEFIGKYDELDIDEIWQEYFAAIEAMAQSKYFDIVGHLDLIKVFKFLPKQEITQLASKALDAIAEAGMSIELNMSGYRKPIGEPYPSKALLKEAFRRGIPLTFGSDAHKPQQIGLFDKEIIQLAHDVGYKECVYYIHREMHSISF